MKTVLFLRGLPGSGKSTLASTLYNLIPSNRVHVVSADQHMVDANGDYLFDPKNLDECHNMAYRDFDMILHTHRTDKNCLIMVDNTNTTEWEMGPYRKLVDMVNENLPPRNQFTVTTVIVENRHGNTSIHDVPRKTINAMHNRFEIMLDSNAQQ